MVISSLRVAIPSPRGQTGARGEGTATRRLDHPCQTASGWPYISLYFQRAVSQSKLV